MPRERRRGDKTEIQEEKKQPTFRAWKVGGETTKKKKPRAGMERKGWNQVPFRGITNKDLVLTQRKE